MSRPGGPARPPAPEGEPEDLLSDRDGLFTLALSTAVAVATLGATLAAAALYVTWVAWTAPTVPGSFRRVLVLGNRLRPDGAPSARYVARLARAAALLEREPEADAVLLGGRTGGSLRSEAEAGRAWLTAAGVAARRIAIEDRSRHTLENLSFYRAMAAARPAGPAAIVSCRAHLARAGLMARSFGIVHRLCAPAPGGGVRPAEIMLEALLVHWYVAGSLYARATGNVRMARRIR